MVWAIILWLYAFVTVVALIAMTAYQLISLSDLECDYINPYDSSSRINAVIIPEFVAQGVLCAFFLFSGHFFPFLVMAPITYYHVRLYMKKKHLMDVTEIFSLLNGEKKYRMIKLALYFSIFLIVIYRLVMSAVLLMMDEDGLESLMV